MLGPFFGGPCWVTKVENTRFSVVLMVDVHVWNRFFLFLSTLWLFNIVMGNGPYIIKMVYL